MRVRGGGGAVVTAPHCCEGRGGAARTGVRRVVAAAEWAAPAALLALLPKCPMCVAAYVSLATGVTLSVAAAAYLRVGLVALSLAMLALLTFRLACRVALRGSGA